jgi:ADP-ribosyl-[dinitrogen reductase] hydrolase
MSLATAHRRQRVVGALVGSVVGDALGAPFEFGPSGAFSKRFPVPARGLATEMCGGRGWRPAEWTDDTQMSLLVAGSLLDNDGLNEDDLFKRFQAWLAAGPADVGIQTRSVLGSGLAWDEAASRHFESGHQAAGNGSIMRTTPAAIFFAQLGPDDSADMARRISDLTHGDPAASDGCAIFHRLIAAALDGKDPLDALPAAIADIPTERRGKWQRTLAADWTPASETEGNGAVWPTLGTAVWALRNGWSFEETMRRIIDIGGDTDTIACVAGGLLGAVQGIQAIPSRWTTPLNGELPGNAPVATGLTELQELAKRLDHDESDEGLPNVPAAIDAVEVLDGLWLSNLAGAKTAPADAAVISVCRTYGRITQAERRQVYIADNDENLNVDIALTDILDTIDAVMSDGKPVLVHCAGGQSRTGLVLRAWLCRTRGLSAANATAEAMRLWPHTYLWNDSFTEALERFGRSRPLNPRTSP